MAVLERGGNAFDAAVAAGFVLQIVEPHLNGPGGELPAIVMRAGANAPEVICGQGPFPAAATAEHLRGMGLVQMPGTGLLPGVVPGAFDGWMLLLRDYGTMKLRDVLSYAIFYAEHGFPLVPRIVATIIPAVDYFKTEWPSSGEVWLANGKAPHPDKPFRTPAIAAMYKRILAEAEAAGGDRVRQIEAARTRVLQGLRRRGDRPLLPDRIDGLDRRSAIAGCSPATILRATAHASRQPVSVDYHGFTVHKLGPWSQGPMFLQTLRAARRLSTSPRWTRSAPDFVHTLVEALKLGFADREAFYGDPDAVEVPLATTAVEGLRRRAPQADRRTRLNGGARRATSAMPGRASRACSRWRARKRRSAQAAASRHLLHCRPNGATPCISTSQMRPAT